MKESFYFTHDFNAHDDSKIKKLLRKHGTTGYGIYWYLIELLASETEKWYLPKDYEGIAFDMREECDRIKSVVEDFGLFKFDDNNFWNKRLDSHFDRRAEKSDQARKNAEKRWGKKKEKDATAMQPQCEPNAIKNSKEQTVKEKTIKTTNKPLELTEEFKTLVGWLKNFDDISSPNGYARTIFKTHSRDVVKKAIDALNSNGNPSRNKFNELLEYFTKKEQ